MIELTDEEREYVQKLLEAADKELLHELHHAKNQIFKENLKREVELNERVSAKLAAVLVTHS